jgi:spore germination protein GerM
MAKKAKKIKKKGSPWTIIAIIALVTFTAGVLFMLKYGEKLLPPPLPEEAAMRTLKLYFSNVDGKALMPEERRIKKGPLEAKVKEAIEALIKGPQSGLAHTIPEGTRLLSIEINGATARVNFNKAISDNHPGGSSGELQTIYSVVNTVALNFPEIDAVQILVEGKKRETLAGHIIINRPLGPDKKMIKG